MLGSGLSMVVGKLSSCWLVGAATSHALLDPSLVREETCGSRKCHLVETPSQCWSFLQNIVDQMVCLLSDCMTPVRGLREHTSSRGIQFHCCPSVVDRKFFILRPKMPSVTFFSLCYLFSVSYMKLTWSFCILLSCLLEKRSQENLDSMRN